MLQNSLKLTWNFIWYLDLDFNFWSYILILYFYYIFVTQKRYEDRFIFFIIFW